MPVSELTIDKPIATGVVGEAILLNLTLTPANASNQNATWKSSDTTKATVNTAGRVTLKAAGKVTITATVDGVTVNSVITINEKANNG
ncbi:Ig-like domain-containing protein [Providencia huaxiensis]|uniref:Ig-like domain-containing protein n=1 Tax=Providencia huaxiensis TaxID=2027290 RepID=UPI0019D1E61F|nr:Ig-like domain-containing protein [Providencia huaxiensis]